MATNKDNQGPIRTTLDLDYSYWKQLKAEATNQRVSLRRLITDCLEAAYPPEPKD